MSVLPVGFASASGVDTGDIGHSLRFRSGASAYLSRTPASAGNRKTWKYAGFIKRAALSATYETILLAGTSGSAETHFYWASDGTLRFHNYPGSYTINVQTSSVFRDPTSHLAIELSVDTTQATLSDGIKLKINGVLQTLTGTYTQNTDTYVNATVPHWIGTNYSSVYATYYLSRVCIFDGLTPSSFGYFNTEINEWVTKSQSAVKAVVDAGGTNSFMLDFDNATSLTTLGYDKSNKGNNWTLNNFSLTAGSTYDHMLDVPGNTYATLNPLVPSTNHTLSNGNLTATLSSAADPRFVKASMFVSAGKWSAEYERISGSSIGSCGVGDAGAITSGGGIPQANSVVYFGNGTIYKNAVIQGTFATYTTGNKIRIELDRDNLTCAFYKDNVLVTTITGLTAADYTFGGFANTTGDVFAFNFGQQPLQAGTPTSGFLALCQANLPVPVIKNPTQHFQVKLDTGANIKTTSEAVFPSNFFEWIKDRANANNYQLIDTVRGSSAVLQSNTTAAETTYSAPSGSSVGWVWKAGGAAVTNNAGSISSQVSANVDAGFSIVTYTGTGANATVGHGLGKALGMLIIKNRGTSSTNWPIWHQNGGGVNYVGTLNTINAFGVNGTYWNSANPTSTVFSIGTATDVNESGKSLVAYCFAEIPGYSKIGSYTGNGSADGPYVECGFKPKFVMIKRTDSTGSWQVFDSIRAGYNVDNDQLVANTSAAEVTTDLLDLTANGFKLRSTSTEVNASSGTYIFLAFADVAGKYSLGR